MWRIYAGIICLVIGMKQAREQYVALRKKGGWELRQFRNIWIVFVAYFLGWVPVVLWASALHKRFDGSSNAGWQVLTLTISWGLALPVIGTSRLIATNRKHRAASPASEQVDQPLVEAASEPLTPREQAAMEAWAARNFTAPRT